MESKNDIDQNDEIMLPGFRFHPTDEELVSFYLRRKVQQKPLSIELIKQLDIYKYDPWDLPKMATIGEKEWYFYCPRDRKYRNSARPNRVTTAGFWKATGTDRPIYSSDGTKCIGLKKSLVFYKGRAAKGTKTDWMMHEFRLPTLADSKKPLDKNMPTNDAWAICRIFKKNTIAQRVLSQAWIPPAVERRAESTSPMNSDMLSDNCVGANAAAAANFVNDHEDLSTETRNQTSTSSNLSSVNQGGDCNHDFQRNNAEIPLQASYTAGLQDSYDKVECARSAPVSAYYAMKSMSLPNLEIPPSIYYSHVDPLSLKGTIDLVSCMLQMSPIPEYAGRPPNSDISSSFSFINNNPRASHPSFPCLQSDESVVHSELFYKKSADAHRHSPRLASDINPLSFPSHFYDGLKSNVGWDSPSSTVDFSATHTSN